MALAALVIVALGGAIVLGGGALRRNGRPPPDEASQMPKVEAPAIAASLAGPIPQTHAAPRPVASDLVAPADPGVQGLEREPPRRPLSGIGLASAPKPDATDWSGILLYRPVAGSSGAFDAMGRHVAITGIEGLEPGESCDDRGRSWPCGMRARTAFRAWLGGLAIECDLPKEKSGPKEKGDKTESARCKRGKQDAGEWLVENGWARAVPGGPYEAEEKKAREAHKGMFGRAPDTNMPVVPLTPPVDLPGLYQ